MIDETHICFRNKPFMATVIERGNGLTVCTPVVYNDLSSCGVGLFFSNGRKEICGTSKPRDLIAAWRATEILSRINIIKSKTLSDALKAGIRSPTEHNPDFVRSCHRVITKVSPLVYNEIMKIPVPDQIVKAILDNQHGNPRCRPDLGPITDEVRAETLAWRKEFAAAGVEHPHNVNLRRTRETATELPR